MVDQGDAFKTINPIELADVASARIADLWAEIARTVMLIRQGRAHWSDVSTLLQQINLVQADLRMAGLTIGLLSPWMHDAVSMASASVTLLIASPETIPTDSDGIRRLLGTLPESERQELIQWLETRNGFDVAQWRSISAVTRYSPTTAAFKFPRIEEGVKFLATRNVVTEAQWAKLAAQERVRTVYLPGANKETVNKLRSSLSESFRDGESLADFRKRIDGVTDATRWQVETLFRTQTKQAYLDGVTTILDNPKVGGKFPAVLYQATSDNRTRPHHAAWDGRIIATDSADYTTAKAMQGEYNCRCTLIPLTERRAKQMGWNGGSTPITPPPGPVVKPEPAPAPPKPIVITTTPAAPAPVAPLAPAPKAQPAPKAALKTAPKNLDIKKLTATPEAAMGALNEHFGIKFRVSAKADPDKGLPHLAKIVGAMESLHKLTGIDRKKLSVSVGGRSLDFYVDHDKANEKSVQAYYHPSLNRLGVHETRGAGSIAHEWAHALDYAAVGNGEIAASKIKPNQKKKLSEKQRRVVDAIEAIHDKIGKTDYMRRLAKAANELEAGNPGYKKYVTSRVEVFARVSETYLLRQDGKNKYLNADKRKLYGKYADAIYPTADELDTLTDEFEELFEAYQESSE